MRIIFMGTPDFAVPALAALIASEHEVVAVYSQPPRPAGRGLKLTPSPIHQLAEKHSIPVFTPTSLKAEDEHVLFAAHEADIAVVAAYGLLLPQAILDAPRLGCINIHPSDLPRWRGAAPIQRTLMAGDRQTACCIIQLELGLDTGPVHLRAPYAIPPEMDAGGLHDIMAEMGAKMVLKVLAQLDVNTPPTPAPQSADGVTYAQKITKEDRELDWSRPAQELLNQIRGLSPTPAASTLLQDETVKVYKAQIEVGNAEKPSGLVLDDGLLINCGGGTALRLTELQRAGKSRQNSADFLKGCPVPAGAYAQKTGS